MAEKKKPRFLRSDWMRHSKLGKGRKKKQKWKRPVGRDNKMRQKRTGYPALVAIGYRTDKTAREKINGKKIAIVNNLNDLAKVGKNELIVIGSVGKRKKLEIAEKAKEMKIEIRNINIEKFIKLNRKAEKQMSKEKSKENKK